MDPAAVPSTGVVIDRAAHRRTDEAWLAERWNDPRTGVAHVFAGRAETGGDPRALVLVAPYATDATRLFLGVDADDVAYFAVIGARPGAADADDGDTWRTLREVGAVLAARDAALLVQALGLANWHDAHPRCPRCGAETVIAEAGHLRRCPVDGSQHHPRTDPAVIMLVTDEQGRALLGRSARWQLPMFSTLAGFVEPGESAEDAVAREVLEESGVVVESVEFVASQPWPFPSSLMIGFRARAAGEPPKADGVEMAEVRWFTRDELAAELGSGAVLVPPPLSIARRLIEDWFGAALPVPPMTESAVRRRGAS